MNDVPEDTPEAVQCFYSAAFSIWTQTYKAEEPEI